MKKFILSICLLAGVVLAGFAQKQLTILHTNDTHSAIEPLSIHLDDTLRAGRAGFVRRLNMVDSMRRVHPDLLLFDSGDFSQGSPYYTLFKGDVEIGLMNEMHYDAAVIGNHEFDFGLDNMARIFREAKFPIVCANYDFTGTVVEGVVKPWVIIKRDGVKIGVFGLSPKMDGLVSKDNCKGVKFLDPVATAARVSEFLKKKKKCDVVICLSHLGWKMEPYNVGDSSMIAGSRYIDLVLGGHSHSFFRHLHYAPNADGRKIPVDQNGKSAIFVGKLVVDLKKK